jgi:hypothetical protein
MQHQAPQKPALEEVKLDPSGQTVINLSTHKNNIRSKKAAEKERGAF